MDKELPALTNFILPGGHQSVSFAHLARCVCPEQNVLVALNDEEPVDPLVTSYLNRLSDFSLS